MYSCIYISFRFFVSPTLSKYSPLFFSPPTLKEENVYIEGIRSNFFWGVGGEGWGVGGGESGRFRVTFQIRNSEFKCPSRVRLGRLTFVQILNRFLSRAV